MAEQTTTASVTTTASTLTMDPNHPNHLYASDNPGMTLINTLFDGKGYPGWKRSVLIALSAKNKLGFITGSHPCPASNATDFQAWNRCNDMVTSWILNSLSKDIADSVIYSKTVQELWNNLEHKFGQSNGAELYHLQTELNSLNQGTSIIARYFTKLKKLWDELDSLNSNNQCSYACMCEGKLKLKKSLEDESLIQFLMGLNDTYSQARSNILMINLLPNINLSYSLILQDENQRESYFNPGPSMRRPQVFGKAQEGFYPIKSNAKESFSSFSKTTCRKIVANPSSSSVSVSVSVSNKESTVFFPICTNAASNLLASQHHCPGSRLRKMSSDSNNGFPFYHAPEAHSFPKSECFHESINLSVDRLSLLCVELRSYFFHVLVLGFSLCNWKDW
ncbi:putative premnaspirodiene oxygenase-like [Capsicum annuum]|nr:putative premnaspirodiene oxygenase-like [Capsicum annuum]